MLIHKRLTPFVYSSIGVILVLALLRLGPGMLDAMLTTNGYAPHGFCILWDRQLLWLHVITDALIGLSYVIIALTLTYLVHRARRDIPFHWILLAFGLFIITCGGTHFMSVWTFWTPVYWLSGNVKLVTAVASVATAVAFPPLVPRMLSLVSAAKISQERKQQLEQANNELEILYQKIIEVDDLKTRFFANVSHELRTPLTLVLGSTERMLAAPEVSREQRHNLEMIDRNARLLLQQVNDLLDVARLEAGKMDLTRSTVDLAQLLRVTMAHFDIQAQADGITFVVEAPATMQAQVDAEKIQRVLFNLLANAFKFTPEGGIVRSELHATASQVTIVVMDSGPGVQPELRTAIFERFRQSDRNGLSRAGGTGLGLSIAKEFVEMHNGSIMVDNAPTGGARFQVELPLTILPAGTATIVEPDASKSVTRLPEPAQAGLSPHTEPEMVMTADPEAALILIVEDNPDMRRFIGEALAGTYRIATAADGNAGLAQALALTPDLILSDIMMPTMSGIQLMQAVRSHPELAAIPLVLLTAKADEQLQVKMLQSGVQDYLVKPFSHEELRARLANLIEMKRTRELLQRELASQNHDLADLAHEVTLRKRELEQALQEQARLHEETKQALRLRDEFLAIASHELKTPLTSLVGIAQLLARRSAEQDSLSERDRRAVRTIFEQGTRLNQMIEMLFDLARMDRGQFEIKPIPLDLVELIRRVVEETRPTLQQHTIELQQPQEAMIVAGDALRLEQVLHNLIGNAVKYSPQGGLIRVTLEQQEALARITVTDHGMGIPAEALSQLFQRFYRAPNISYHHISGMGVGLYIVQEIIRHHNGWVEVTSTEDEGTTFSIRLPLHTTIPPTPEDTDHASRTSSNRM